MNFTLADILFCVVNFQLLFAGSFLLSLDRGRKVSNRLLGAFFLAVGLNLIDNFLLIKKIYLISPLLVSWGICLPLLFGPLLYSYTQSVLYREFRLSGSKWLHFLPFILLFVATEVIYLTQDRSRLLATLNGIADRRIPVIFYWSSTAIFFQYFGYVVASLLLIRR